jgi:hypothetical protein
MFCTVTIVLARDKFLMADCLCKKQRSHSCGQFKVALALARESVPSFIL